MTVKNPRTPSRPATGVFILGMHRSGTSALTRTLNLLGVDLGTNLMGAAADNNEAGFWEHQDVVDTHERLLGDMGYAWDDARALPKAWETGTAAAYARGSLVEVLRKEFETSKLWGVKDPRQCRLVPLWMAAASELGVRPAFVIMLRNPLEIARSLSRRDGLPAGRALLLWMRYTLEAERETRGENRCFVDYDGLMQDWRATAGTIETALHLGLTLDDAESAAAIDSFVSPRLRHHTLNTDELRDTRALAEWAGRIQEILSESAPDGPDLSGQQALDRIQESLDQAAFYFDDVVKDSADRERRLTDEMRTLHERVHEKEIAVAERDHTMEVRSEQATQQADLLRTAIEAKGEQITFLQGVVVERDNKISLDREHIEGLKAHIHGQAKNYDAQITSLNGDLADARNQIKLAERRAEYIEQSWSWRLALPLRITGRSWQSLLGSLRLRKHRLYVNGLTNIEHGDGGNFVATDSDCHVFLGSNKGRLPAGWVEFTYEVDSPHFLAPSVFADDGYGISEAGRIQLPPTRGGRVTTPIRLPNRTIALRFDPVNQPGPFSIKTLEIRELNALGLATSVLLRRARDDVGAGGGFLGMLRMLFGEWRSKGMFGVKSVLRREALERALDYPTWFKAFGHIGALDRAAMQRHVATFEEKPTVLAAVRVGKHDPAMVAETVTSLKDQIYSDTRIVLIETADVSSQNRHANATLAGGDSRTQVLENPDSATLPALMANAIGMTSADILVLLEPGDRLAPQATYAFAAKLASDDAVSVVYGDEDTSDRATGTPEPSFKPEWSPDLFLSRNYMGNGVALRVRDVETAGGLRDGVENAEIYDLILRLAAASGSRAVAHVAMVLCHRRSQAISKTAVASASRAVEEHLQRTGVSATIEAGRTPDSRHVVYALPATPPKVSLIVPTRDRVELLRICVDGVLETNNYPNWEMIIVDNGSEDRETLSYMAERAKDPRISILRDDGPFNFSRLNNDAVAMAKGDIIGLLNNDIEPIHADWLTEMVRQVIQPGVGAVGAKLYYPDDTVQHGGVIVGVGGLAGHFHKHLKREERGFDDRLMLVQNLSAVTAACMLVPKAVFEEVEGLDTTHLAVAFNDVDLCLKIVEAGYRIVWTPFAELYHHESVSRGDDMAPDKIDRFRYEVQTMQARWAKRLKQDPYYSPNLALTREVVEPAFPPRYDRPWEAHFEV